MAVYPGALWRPLPGTSKTRISSYDVLCWHTMVGSLAGTDNYFRTSAAGTNSHFGIGADGTVYQWVDTAYRSGANYNGNPRIISVETADTGAPFPKWSGSDVPAWTPQQVEAGARLASWVRQTHGIPLDLIPDAKPGRRGNGYHRQGVPGYMVAGAEQWSTKTGKVCPGDRRIGQIPQLLTRARQIAGGAPAQEADMPLNRDDENVIYRAVTNVVLDITSGASSASDDFAGYLAAAVNPQIASLQGRVDGLSEALRQVAAAPGQAIDLAAVQAAAKAGTAEAIKAIDVTVRAT